MMRDVLDVGNVISIAWHNMVINTRIQRGNRDIRAGSSPKKLDNGIDMMVERSTIIQGFRSSRKEISSFTDGGAPPSQGDPASLDGR